MTDYSTDAVAWRRYEQARPRTGVALDPDLYGRYVGTYRFDEGSIVMIARREGGLTVQMQGQSAVDIHPEREDTFFLTIVPAQITFACHDDDRAMTLVLHQDGYEQEAHRIDEAKANDLAEDLERRIRNRTPIDDSERLLHVLIEDATEGRINFDRMSPALAAAARDQAPLIQADLAKAGALTHVAFKGVSPEGWDVYDVQFEHAAMEWRFIVGDDGKLSGAFIRPLP